MKLDDHLASSLLCKAVLQIWMVAFTIGLASGAEDYNLQMEAVLGDAKKCLPGLIQSHSHLETKLGFSDDSPLEAATIGVALPLFVLDAAFLAKNPDSKLNAFSKRTGSYVCTVVSKGKVCCLLFMDKLPDGEGYQHGMFGRSNMAKMLAAALKRWQPKALALYTLPQSGSFYLSVLTEEEANLSPIADLAAANYDAVRFKPRSLASAISEINQSLVPTLSR
ncbi:MAG: hypothetical protein JNJ83_21520 [Verrucomicrobiaceae bacterium]|nr:hypothetical protein [Verrucomicrobiaceae bacterium]